jgi:hypothetical protein
LHQFGGLPVNSYFSEIKYIRKLTTTLINLIITKHFKTAACVVLVFLCFFLNTAHGSEHPEAVHEITLYVIPSTEPLDWESPGSLLRSFYHSYTKSVFVREKHLMGHLFIGLESPLIEQPFFIGIAAGSKEEQRRLMLKEKIGFSILKADLKGKIESTPELMKKLTFYKKREELLQVTFRVSEPGMQRVVDFIKAFQARFNEKHAPSNFYGGEFYPRFDYEGSGCTAMGMAMLELCGITLDRFGHWLVNVKIPMEIIGGKYNQGNEVTLKDLRQVESWYQGAGTENIDYISNSIYDPSLIFMWIKQQLELPNNQAENEYTRCTKNGIDGLCQDFSMIRPLPDEPIFLKRSQPSIFIDGYFMKNGFPLQVEENDSIQKNQP